MVEGINQVKGRGQSNTTWSFSFRNLPLIVSIFEFRIIFYYLFLVNSVLIPFNITILCELFFRIRDK